MPPLYLGTELPVHFQEPRGTAIARCGRVVSEEGKPPSPNRCLLPREHEPHGCIYNRNGRFYQDKSDTPAEA